MTAKEYYKSTRMVETRNWTLEMALNFAEEYAEALRKHAVIKSVCDGCIHNECKNTWVEPCHSCSNGNNKQTEV